MRTLMDKHNEAVVVNALAANGGKSRVSRLKLICSDDETVCRVIERMEGVIRPDRVHPSSVVELST